MKSPGLENQNIVEDVVSGIVEAILGGLPAVKERFLWEFGHELPEFAGKMAEAYLLWKEFDQNPTKDERKAHISAFIFRAMNYHVQALHLFLIGLPIPSGHMERQVLESIAMAFLCSDRTLDFADRYIAGKFGTNRAVDALVKHQARLQLEKNSVLMLKEVHSLYDKVSHPTLLNLGFNVTIGVNGPSSCFGPAFDEGKIGLYRVEMNRLCSLAVTFPNFIQGVERNWVAPSNTSKR